MPAMHRSLKAWLGGTANMPKSKILAMHINMSNRNWRPALVESVYGLSPSQHRHGNGAERERATQNDDEVTTLNH